MSDKGRINRYLFSEFGYDLEHEPSTISHNWPFELHAVGMISSSGRETEVLGFAADDQDYYVLLGESLSFLPAAGMSLQDLQLQQNGQDWIDSQDPIDLATSRPLDGAVPSAIERRASIEELAASACSSLRLLKGVYLRATGTYLALIEDASGGEAMVIGTGLATRLAPFPRASPWRRLALVIGQALDKGLIRVE